MRVLLTLNDQVLTLKSVVSFSVQGQENSSVRFQGPFCHTQEFLKWVKIKGLIEEEEKKLYIKVEQQLVKLYIEGRCALFFIWYVSFNKNILFVTKQNNLVLAESYISMRLVHYQVDTSVILDTMKERNRIRKNKTQCWGWILKHLKLLYGS